jgi:hypothetical protein
MNQSRGALQVVAVANLIICALMLLFSAPFFLHQVEVLRTWPTAEAQVLHSDVVVDRISEHEQFYSARIGLLYTVNGKPITTELTSFQDHNYRKTRARSDQFAVGSRHEIRYSPSDPLQARIGAGWNARFFALPLIVGGVGAGFGVLAGVLFAVSRR